MCGINGIFAYHYAANPIDRAELIRTRDHMAARGPDGSGAWFADDGRIALGHRRLAIIDLSDAGAQPMVSADGRLAVTFNGEIYNYRELRQHLETKGYVFRSHSDTEVLLHLYADKGEAMVHDLRGMFAFAIWDATKRTLFLARDPYGIKPLYYADDGWTFRFASQVKALLAGERISREPDPAGHVGFFLWGSVPEPFTTYQAIKALPAGSTLVVDALGTQECRRYFSIAHVYQVAERQVYSEPPWSQTDALIKMRAATLESVQHHLIADVPIGVFLSGGIDSGSLLGLIHDCGRADVETVTVAFDEFRGGTSDEAPRAAQVARHYGTRHTTRIVTESEFRTDLPAILAAMDQPTIDGVNTWFVAKAARELGLKVAISGIGGDELLGGYPSFVDIPRWVKWLGVPSRLPLLGRVTRQALSTAFSTCGMGHPKAAGLIEYGGSEAGAYLLRRGLYMPWELDSVLDANVIRVGLRRLKPLARLNGELSPRTRSAHARVSTLESGFYLRNQLLRDTDWTSMAHSLEVRTPLVDAVLLRRMAPLVATTKTAPMRKRDLASCPRLPLPTTSFDQDRTGFMTPLDAWQRRRREDGLGSPSLTGSSWARMWAREVVTA